MCQTTMKTVLCGAIARCLVHDHDELSNKRNDGRWPQGLLYKCELMHTPTKTLQASTIQPALCQKLGFSGRSCPRCLPLSLRAQGVWSSMFHARKSGSRWSIAAFPFLALGHEPTVPRDSLLSLSSYLITHSSSNPAFLLFFIHHLPSSLEQ